MGHSYFSRREILRSIPVLGSADVLATHGDCSPGLYQNSPAGSLRGRLLDAASGLPVAAKIRVTNLATGQVHLPAGAVKTMPKQSRSKRGRYFYARGTFEAALPPGAYQVEVVRGICHEDRKSVV